jgi:ArsR family transcriptional regulator
MTEQDRLRADTRAGVLKALAHPTRIYIVDLIEREGPHCVQDLTERVGVDTSTVSRHLSILKNAGILSDRKEGTTVYYSLSCGCIADFMSGLEGLLRARHMRDQQAYAATFEPTAPTPAAAK